MSSSPKKKHPERAANGSVVATVFSKAISPEASWNDKDEFLDVIYWMRQIIGVILGLIWGILHLKGFIGLILFFAVNCGVVYLYYGSFQKVDDEEYGGPTEILKEGLMTSFSTFLIKEKDYAIVDTQGWKGYVDSFIFITSYGPIAQVYIITVPAAAYVWCKNSVKIISQKSTG